MHRKLYPCPRASWVMRVYRRCAEPSALDTSVSPPTFPLPLPLPGETALWSLWEQRAVQQWLSALSTWSGQNVNIRLYFSLVGNVSLHVTS